MDGISVDVKQTGDFDAEDWCKQMEKEQFLDILAELGEWGVSALSSATPVDTGESAASWWYWIEDAENPGSTRIVWANDHVTKWGTPIVVLVQYGHGTRNGGYVEGRDFINPALAPIIDEVVEAIWKVVTQS